ncbi:MAG: nidogen-like domain-containing protein, partial [Bacteroidota bacterium]
DISSNYIQLPFSFDFYGTQYDSVIINNNGNISFLAPYFEFTANPFPDPSYNMIAPFWGDVDTRSANGGNVWYKVTNDALIVIWDHVGYFDMNDNLTNTFQLVISNGQDTIIHGNNNISFCYGDMQWTTGDASSGVGGFGGFAATVGVNIGNGVDFFQVGQFDAPGTGFDGPYALTDQVDFLDDQEVYFDVAGMNAANIPPLVINSNICDTIDVYTGDTLHKSMNIAQFTLSLMTPEFGQILTYGISSDAPTGFSFIENVNSGDYIALECSFDAQGLQEGLYHIFINASDNGVPAESIAQSIPVRVHQGQSAGIATQTIAGLQVFPNPTNGSITLSAHEELARISLISMNGNVVFERMLDGIESEISGIAPGSYLLRVTNRNDQVQTLRVEVLP